ncbi:MAG: hypothetical protein AAFV69_13580 [Pseudomonadota bacterium]
MSKMIYRGQQNDGVAVAQTQNSGRQKLAYRGVGHDGQVAVAERAGSGSAALVYRGVRAL